MRKNIFLVKFKPGDIGLSRNNSWISKIILWVESVWTKDANFSHAYVLIGTNIVVEALDKIRISPLNKYDNKSTKVWRIPLTAQERIDFQEGMYKRIGGAYGYLKYPGFILDAASTVLLRFFGKKTPVFIFSKVLGLSNIPVCSQLVVWGIHKYTTYRFLDAQGKIINWREVNPDRLEDLLGLKINFGEIIYSSS